eukprot:Phypoly_transcript_17351.p1 GENE.Phypoly_transcript_17351~~Phypoly_transcript_17351.p1  ORF type:complete len:125 (+),score=30.31 Phypoly_transcript_17351:350-724(+)
MNLLPRTSVAFRRPFVMLRNPTIVRFASSGGNKEKVEFTSSEQNKVDIATQVTDAEGKHTKSKKNWNPELASTSEEIVHAERKEARKPHTYGMEEMQQKSIRKIHEKEKELKEVDKKENVEDKS